MFNSKIAIAVGVVLVVGLVVLSQSVFTVDQAERAIVLQLGKPVAGPLEPGIHVKVPFVQNSVHFDARILDYDARPAEILTKDKKAMVVDNYTKWRINDPLQFYRTVRTVDRAKARLDDIIYSQVRVALGQRTLHEIVALERGEIMSQVTRKSRELVTEYGIEVIDLRIKRTDLPPENERAIFGRMSAERERQAKQYRSEGREEAAKIKAKVDRERQVILAEADRKSQVLRGQGDAQAITIFAAALNKDPEFFNFQRSLEAYAKSFENKTRLVLTPDSEFLRYMR
jgi:membrane protease subunit HflC